MRFLPRGPPPFLTLLAAVALSLTMGLSLAAPPASGQAGSVVCSAVDLTCDTSLDMTWAPDTPGPGFFLDPFTLEVELVYGYDATNAALSEGDTRVVVRVVEPEGDVEVEPPEGVIHVPIGVDGRVGPQEVRLRTGFMMRCHQAGTIPVTLEATAHANGGFQASETSGQLAVACPERPGVQNDGRTRVQLRTEPFPGSTPSGGADAQGNDAAPVQGSAIVGGLLVAAVTGIALAAGRLRRRLLR